MQNGPALLQIALDCNNLDAIIALIKRGVDFSRATKDGIPMLHWAAAIGFKSVFLHIGKNIAQEQVNDLFLRDCSPIALEHNQTPLLIVFLMLGADMTGLNKDGMPIIFWAIQNNHLSLIDYLTSRTPALIDMQHAGKTSFQFTLEIGNIDAAVCLLHWQTTLSEEFVQQLIDTNEPKLLAAALLGIVESRLNLFEIFFYALSRGNYIAAEYISYNLKSISEENIARYRRLLDQDLSELSPENQEILQSIHGYLRSHFPSARLPTIDLQPEQQAVGYYTARYLAQQRLTKAEEEIYHTSRGAVSL